MKKYSNIEKSYPTTTIEGFSGGAFSIYSALNCPERRPIPSNKCFCTQPTRNSIWPQCQKYKGKKNMCMETQCCSSCDINKTGC
jgi:hypothetical protein